MSANGRALVDSSVWVSFFSGLPRAVDLLTRVKSRHNVVICGQIKQEVLQGSRDAKALTKLEREMAIWTYEAEQPEDFVEAARIYARLRWKGVTVPPSDCLIAGLAKRCGLPICALDPHFDAIPDIRVVVE